MTGPTLTGTTLPGLAETTEMTTRDGVVLSIRPAFAEDEPALEEFFDKVSDEDRRFRFLSAQKHVGHEKLELLTHVDHWKTESFLGFDKASGELVASALLACDAQMDCGEVAVSIRQDYRGRGVAWTILDHVGQEARRRGLKRVISIEDRANHAAIELERERGYSAHAFDGDPHLVLLEKRFD